MSNMKNVKCVVSCRNGMGVPDFFFIYVKCTEDQYDDGGHYNIAAQAALDDGYSEMGLVYDEKDCPALMNLFEWNTAEVVEEK